MSTEALRAGIALGRLDHRLAARGEDAPEIEWFVRREAIAIAAREGRLTDEIRYCGYVEQISNEASDQSLRLAADIGDALRIVLSWRNSPTPADVRQIWETTNRSNIMILGAERQWQLDSAYGRIAASVDLMLTDSSIEKLEHLFQGIWTETAFGSAGRRMAMVMAPYMIRRAFDAPAALVGLAKNVAIQTDVLEEIDQDDRVADLVSAILKGSIATMEASLKIARLETEFFEGLQTKKGRGMERAIGSLIARPIVSAGRLAKALDVTHKGAIFILERFEEAGMVVKFDPNMPRTKSFICHKAINL